MKNIFILLFATLCAMPLIGQGTAVKDFEEKAEGHKLYLYQSVLRVLNKDKNPDFNRLIKNLDHVRFITMTKSEDSHALKEFKSLDSEIRNEGFENIMEFDHEEMHLHIYELSSRKSKTIWLATFHAEGRAGLIEMAGTLDLKYLHALESMDWEKLDEMMPIKQGDKPAHPPEKESPDTIEDQ